MDTNLTLLGAMVALCYGIGGVALAVLPGWCRKRREETVRRQIALTDAIDAQVGAIVSPVVRKPLWGPLQIEITVPLARPATVGRILAIAHEVLSVVEGMRPASYRIVLGARQDSI